MCKIPEYKLTVTTDNTDSLSIRNENELISVEASIYTLPALGLSSRGVP